MSKQVMGYSNKGKEMKEWFKQCKELAEAKKKAIERMLNYSNECNQ